jgi:hypothetical protein
MWGGSGSSGRIGGRVGWDKVAVELMLLTLGLLRGVGGEFFVLTGVAVFINGAYRLTPPAYSEAISRDSS